VDEGHAGEPPTLPVRVPLHRWSHRGRMGNGPFMTIYDRL